MRLDELMDMVRVLVPAERMATLTDGALAQALNVAQEDVSRNLRAPTSTVLISDVASAAAFAWPADARDDGILRVYALTKDDAGDIVQSGMIPVYDPGTASQYDPAWTLQEPAEVADYIVYDPTSSDGPVPVPPPDATHLQSFRVTYVVRPAKMSAMSDVPFGGQLESFHDVLAYRAAWLLSQSAAMLREYERRLNAARGASTHQLRLVQNPLYSRNVIQNGRG